MQDLKTKSFFLLEKDLNMLLIASNEVRLTE